MLSVMFLNFCDLLFYHAFEECNQDEVPLLGDDMQTLLTKLNNIQWDTVVNRYLPGNNAQTYWDLQNSDSYFDLPLTFQPTQYLSTWKSQLMTMSLYQAGTPSTLQSQTCWTAPMLPSTLKTTSPVTNSTSNGGEMISHVFTILCKAILTQKPRLMKMPLSNLWLMTFFSILYRWRINELEVLLLDHNNQVIPSKGVDIGQGISLGIHYPPVFNDIDSRGSSHTFLAQAFYCRSTYQTHGNDLKAHKYMICSLNDFSLYNQLNQVKMV